MTSIDMNLGSVIASLALFVLYHIILFSLIYFPHGFEIPFASNLENGLMWIVKHKDKGDAQSVTLAVQTLRNTIMVAVFVGGYAFTTAVSTIQIYPGLTTGARQTQQTNEAHHLEHTLQLAEQQQDSLSNLNPQSLESAVSASLKTSASVLDKQIATGIVTVLMFLSVLCWAIVIRSAAQLSFHLGVLSYLVGLPEDSPLLHPAGTNTSNSQQDGDSGQAAATDTATTELTEIERKQLHCDVLVQRMLFCFSMGFRLLFICIPYIMLGIGPLELVIASVVIVWFLYNWDFAGNHHWLFRGESKQE